MTSLAALWLPILLSAVFVFVASSLVHMVLQWHTGDYRKVSDEGNVLDAIRSARLPAGQYMFPGCDSMKEMGTPEMLAKFQQGPVGVMVLRASGMPNMGKALGQWFLLCLVIGVLVAYVASLSIAPGAAFAHVFRVTSAVALLGYAFSSVTDSIWKGISWSTTARFVADGTVYALITGATFAWLWPAAA